MIDAIKKFEKAMTAVLAVMMVAIVLFSIVDLAWNLAQDIVSPPMFLLDVSELLDIFGFVMLTIIGLELLETIRAYLKENVVHVEVVLEVALIAIARKIIILDVKKVSALSLIGIAAIVVTLAVAFYLLKQKRYTHDEEDTH